MSPSSSPSASRQVRQPSPEALAAERGVRNAHTPWRACGLAHSFADAARGGSWSSVIIATDGAGNTRRYSPPATRSLQCVEANSAPPICSVPGIGFTPGRLAGWPPTGQSASACALACQDPYFGKLARKGCDGAAAFAGSYKASSWSHPCNPQPSTHGKETTSFAFKRPCVMGLGGMSETRIEPATTEDLPALADLLYDLFPGSRISGRTRSSSCADCGLSWSNPTAGAFS